MDVRDLDSNGRDGGGRGGRGGRGGKRGRDGRPNDRNKQDEAAAAAAAAATAASEGAEVPTTIESTEAPVASTSEPAAMDVDDQASRSFVPDLAPIRASEKKRLNWAGKRMLLSSSLFPIPLAHSSRTRSIPRPSHDSR